MLLLLLLALLLLASVFTVPIANSIFHAVEGKS
jgi:hypothetical protein